MYLLARLLTKLRNVLPSLRIMFPELISNYVPMMLFTLASFSSFDMEPNRGNDRIGFLITLFLVLSTMSVNITGQTPGANQITFIGAGSSFVLTMVQVMYLFPDYIEWYSFICMLFTFASLVEYGFILAILKPKEKTTGSKRNGVEAVLERDKDENSVRM